MSEGDLLGSPEEFNVNNHRRGRRTTSPSSPPRSRSQSTGSAHREALLFFERHQLFRENSEERSSLAAPIGVEVDTTDWEQQLDSTEISSFSKTPSPAHISDVKSSTDEERNNCPPTECVVRGLLDIPGRKTSKSKSDNLALSSSTSNDNPRPCSSSRNSVGGNDTRRTDAITEENLIRKRSIRGRSHSQPSQVFLCTTGESSRKNSGSKRDKYNWLDQIQFRAQYQHYRTNDYSSVVNSASSLDKASSGPDQTTGGIPQIGERPPPHQIHTQPCSCSSNHSLNGSQISGLSSSATTNKNPSATSALCWNFPRVKLPRIFNAKSLDDILGRSRKSLVNSSLITQAGETEYFSCEDPSSTSSGVGITASGTFGVGVENLTEGVISGNLSDISNTNYKSKNSSLTSLKIHNPFATSSKSLGLYNSSSCVEKVDEGASNKTDCPLVISSSTIKSKGKVRKSSGSSSIGSTSTHVTSALSSVLLRIPKFQPNSDKKSRKKGKEKPSKSLSSGSLNRVACTNANAKSDNYLNRIVASATCARFNVGKSVDNLTVYSTTSTSNANIKSSSILETQKSKRNRNSSGTTLVEPYFKSDLQQSSANQPQQRRWTAVKQKWDLKLQPPTESSDSDNPQNTKSHTQSVLFIKSQLNRISGVPTTTNTVNSERDFHPQSSHCEQEAQLESLTSHANTSPFHYSYSTDIYIPTKPHEPGRVSFRLEPEEIPSRDSPISRSQSSDCKPQEIKPHLLNLENTPAEEESEEMTKSRHFHYRDFSSGSGGNGKNHRKDEHLSEITPNKVSAMTKAKPKPSAQLVVANLSYLQRPTSPCLMLAGDTSSNLQPQQLSSSPIVFSNNNNYPTSPHVQQQSITSPISPTNICKKPDERFASYHARMKQEYFEGSSSGGGLSNLNSFNLNEPRENIENINTSSSQYSQSAGGGGGFSSFVPCYNRNDIVSPTTDMMTGANNTNNTGAFKAKNSLYGDGRVEFHQNPRHDDNSYKDNRSNKNANPLGGSSFQATQSPSSFSRPGGSGPIDSDQSSRFQRELSLAPNCMKADETVLVAVDGTEIPTQYGDAADQNSRQKSSQCAPTSSGNQQKEESLSSQSQRTNNNIQSTESTEEEEEEEMGDLQSPTYVKRTANMFNSRYSSQHNGSASSVTDHNIKDSHNPSYLNVSRSVSGYSCLSYNNGVANGSSVSTSTTTNGSPYSQKFITKPSTKVRTEFTVRVNQSPQRSNSTDGEGDVDVDDRLIKSPSSNKSRYLESSTATEETDSSYVPSHGKSFIMQRIERLYGSDAVSSSGVFTRKSVGVSGGVTTTTVKFETSLQQSPNRCINKERIIPIQVEQDQEYDRSPVVKQPFEKHSYERIIRGDEMINDDSDCNNPLTPSPNMKSVKHSYTHKTNTTAGLYEGIALEPCPGKHQLHTISLDEDEKQLLKRSNGETIKTSRPTSVRQPEKYVNGNHTNGNGPSRNKDTKNDSGILDDMIIGPSEESENLNRYPNDANKPSLKSPSNSLSSKATKYNKRSSPTADDSGIIDPEEGETEGAQKPSASLYSYRKNSQSSSSSSAGGSPEPSGSPSKPQLKPKPKDMALLRTLSHSPTPKGLLADRNLGAIGSLESQNKTAAATVYSNITLEKIIGPNSRVDKTEGDQTDSDKKLSDIRNILKVSSGTGESGSESYKGNLQFIPEGPVKREDHQRDKENDFKPASPTEVKDGNYFLNEMRNARKELERLVEISNNELGKLDQQSEKAGNILSVVGKSNLLIKKKFKQFEELCNANLDGVTGDQPETTNEDLAGFWDMVMIQIDQVYAIFKELHRKHDHETQSTDVPDGAVSKTSSSRKAVPSSTKVTKILATKSQTSAAAKARDESRRRLLAEKRRLMKEQAQEVGTTTQDEVLIFTPENN